MMIPVSISSKSRARSIGAEAGGRHTLLGVGGEGLCPDVVRQLLHAVEDLLAPCDMPRVGEAYHIKLN